MAGKKSRAKIVWFDAAARRFNVTPDTLREWIEQGRFPQPQGVGNRLFYSLAELDAIVTHGLLGRWGPLSGPDSTPGKSRKEPEKRGKGQDLEGSTG